jgi:hypothetical protein
MSLTCIALDKFDKADPCKSVGHEQSGISNKDAGIMWLTFSGRQSQYKVWNSKWHAYLGNMKNADGIPLLYVIVHLKKEKQLVRHQLRGASLKGSQFQTDNFKVRQLLESALADGSVSIFKTTQL